MYKITQILHCINVIHVVTVHALLSCLRLLWSYRLISNNDLLYNIIKFSLLDSRCSHNFPGRKQQNPLYNHTLGPKLAEVVIQDTCANHPCKMAASLVLQIKRIRSICAFSLLISVIVWVSLIALLLVAGTMLITVIVWVSLIALLLVAGTMLIYATSMFLSKTFLVYKCSKSTAWYHVIYSKLVFFL